MTDGATQGIPFWSIDTERLLQKLDTTAEGLTQTDAEERLARASKLQTRRHSAWSLLWDQFKSPIIVLLFCSAILSYALDDRTNACIIFVILIASGLLGFWQEWGAADAVAKLLGMIETKATVLRDGQERDIPLEAVVPGDVVRLRAGALIPSDCRLLTSRDLYLNEAVLTGESFPAEKSVIVLPEATPLGQRINALYLGTHVISGMGTAVVAATGRETEFGRISERLEHKQPETGFERGLRHFGQLLIKIVVVITVAVFAVNVTLGKPLVETLVFALSLAVGMTPQLLPAITSVVLAAGAKAMSRQQVIVKQLLAIENLGSMTVLCSDKTGTLTEGVIHLQETLDVAGRPSERILRLAWLNAHFQAGFENPIDRSIRDKQAFDISGIEKLDEIPYDFIRKRLSVRIRQNDGRRLLITKGALANILECSTQVETVSGDLVDIQSQREQIDRRFAEMSDQGLRVLGLAVREDNAEHISRADERDMTFLGFLVFADPPKADAKETLQQLRDLGVALKVITGDNRAVAASISHRVGIESPVIVTGSDLRTLSEEAVRQRVHDADVFAEVEPNQKEQIILSLKHSGEVVGYLGDGINDASALHAADVGISVATAVDVAREAAQVVLLKQDLGVLVQGVREGRRTFANTLKYVFFAIAANFGYMLSQAILSLLLPFLPLLAFQILLVNLLADFPAMALATDSVDPEQIHRPRRWDIGFVTRFMLSFGLTSSCFDFLTFGVLYWLYGSDEGIFHTGWFVESTLTGLMIMLVIRTQRPFFLSKPGKLLSFACLCIAIVTLLLPYSPFATALEFVTPPPLLLPVTVVITLLYGVGMEFVKRLFYRYLAT